MDAQATQQAPARPHALPRTAEELAAAAQAAGVPRAELASRAPAVDVRAINPMRFRDLDAAGYAAVISAPSNAGLEEGLGLLARVGEREPVRALVPGGAEPPGLPAGVSIAELTHDLAATLRKVGRHLGVIDHPSFHSSEWERAGWIVRLSAAGVPVVVAEPSERLGELLGAELSELLAPITARQLADLDVRERLSVSLRRVALREHSVEARWRQVAEAAGIEVPPRPTVSVLLATRRQEWLAHGLAQVERQNYEPRELIVCLHGEGFSEAVEEEIRGAVSGTVKIVRVDGELTLGEALNAGIEASSGELITKMDDDDYYSADHLWDLVLALDYSGADLVGKAAEFVYLEEIDVTVRQISHDVDTRLAGGGMMMLRAPLVDLGGWPKRTRGEDLAIIRMYHGAGNEIHRIPPHGYILNRHGRGHTWRPAVDYFLFRSEQQWRGLRLDETAIE